MAGTTCRGSPTRSRKATTSSSRRWRTPGAASPPTSSPRCGTHSSPPRVPAAARAWASPSPARSSSCTAGPSASPTVNPAAHASPLSLRQNGATNMPPKKRILVVDDERDMTLLVKLNLQKTGRYEVKEENRATRALATAREYKPDLILLDVMMPEMDGGDVLAQFKDDANLRSVPVIFLTATVLKEEVSSQGGTIGGYPFIPKP